MTYSRCCLGACLFASTLLAAGSYKLVKTIPIPGEGGWDYLAADSSNRQLYVSHATEVDVVNMDSGAVVGKIPGTNGVHGIAIANDLAADSSAMDVTIRSPSST